MLAAGRGFRRARSRRAGAESTAAGLAATPRSSKRCPVLCTHLVCARLVLLPRQGADEDGEQRRTCALQETKEMEGIKGKTGRRRWSESMMFAVGQPDQPSIFLQG